MAVTEGALSIPTAPILQQRHQDDLLGNPSLMSQAWGAREFSQENTTELMFLEICATSPRDHWRLVSGRRRVTAAPRPNERMSGALFKERGKRSQGSVP